MSEWMYVLIGVGIGVLMIPLLLYFGFRLLLWKIKKTLTNAMGDLQGALHQLAAGGYQTPLRVKLETAPGPLAWSDAAQIEQWSRELQALPLERVGEFAIPEMPQVQTAIWKAVDDSAVAYVQEHAALNKRWVDLIRRHTDGTVAMVTSAEPSGLDAPPKRNTVNLPGASIAQLWEKLQEMPCPAEVRPTPADQVVSAFEEGYAEYMDWRVERGGSSREEFLEQARRSGTPLTGEGLDQAMEAAREENLAQIQELLRIRYEEAGGKLGEEWEVVFIHDRMRPKDLADYANLEGILPSLPPREMMARGIEQMPAEVRPIRVGSVAGSIEADVYRLLS